MAGGKRGRTNSKKTSPPNKRRSRHSPSPPLIASKKNSSDTQTLPTRSSRRSAAADKSGSESPSKSDKAQCESPKVPSRASKRSANSSPSKSDKALCESPRTPSRTSKRSAATDKLTNSASSKLGKAPCESPVKPSQASKKSAAASESTNVSPSKSDKAPSESIKIPSRASKRSAAADKQTTAPPSKLDDAPRESPAKPRKALKRSAAADQSPTASPSKLDDAPCESPAKPRRPLKRSATADQSPNASPSKLDDATCESPAKPSQAVKKSAAGDQPADASPSKSDKTPCESPKIPSRASKKSAVADKSANASPSKADKVTCESQKIPSRASRKRKSHQDEEIPLAIEEPLETSIILNGDSKNKPVESTDHKSSDNAPSTSQAQPSETVTAETNISDDLPDASSKNGQKEADSAAMEVDDSFQINIAVEENDGSDEELDIAPVPEPQLPGRARKLTPQELGFATQDDGTMTIEDISIPPAPVPNLSLDAVQKERLIITDIDIENFKSYAGIQKLYNFNKNFTAVVGPNGSGKSNVIDSLLFVFGKKANEIRSKCVSALIHKSDFFPNLSHCSVTVQLAYIKDSPLEIVPNSRFEVKRCITNYKDSNYYYNRKKIKSGDLVKLLKAHGIDMEHGRFLILQGEIEAISLMPPKAEEGKHETGMLEYVEDVIGSNRLIEPIKQFTKRVAESVTVVDQKNQDLKIVESQRQQLEGPKNIAVEYLRLENKLHLTQNSLFHLQRFEAQKDLENAVAKKEKVSSQLKTLKEKIDEIRNSRKSLETEIQQLTSEYESAMKKWEDSKALFAGMEKEDEAIKTCSEHAKEKRNKLEKKIQTAKNDLEKLAKQTETYEKETSELEKKREKLEQEKMNEDLKITEAMGSVQQETDKLQQKKDTLEKELVKLKSNVHSTKSEMDIVQSELDFYVGGENQEKERLENLILEHRNAIEAAESEEKLMNKEETELANVKEELESLTKEHIELVESENSTQQQLQTECVKLEEAKGAMLAVTSQGKIMKSFSEEKARGRFLGVHGRLGDLGAIDQKFDVAISTACPQLDQLVTDVVNTAQECIKHLKSYNLGYTTFIPLDKMRQWEKHSSSKISTPENVNRLFDLITVKNREFLPAFYFALRDTLVARDLEQATRIGLQGRQRYRVVTLRGELIDLAGTMSGGGNTVQRGRMGQKITNVECSFTSSDISKREDDLNALRRKLGELKRKRLSIEECISQKNLRISSLENSLKKRRINCKAYNERVAVIDTQVKQQEVKAGKSTIDKKKVKDLENQIKEINGRYTKSVEQCSSVEEKVASIQAEILQISKGKLSKSKKLVEQLEKKLNEVKQSITKSSVNLKTSLRNIKKNENNLSTCEKELEEIKTKYKEYKQQREAMTEKGMQVMEEIAEFEKKAVSLKEKKTLVKKDVDASTQKEQTVKSEEIEVKNKLKEIEAKEAEKRALIRHINAKISKLKLNKVEDDSTDIPELSEQDISRLSITVLESDIEIAKAKLDEKKPDLSKIEEYYQKESLCQEKKNIYEEVKKHKALEEQRLHFLQEKRKSEFNLGQVKIGNKLKEIYQMLARGGDAEMQFDFNDPFRSGIAYMVRPSKKQWKSMRFLSGGEKTLGSLALVFALHYYRPTPFYVMDEIDAALDSRNVSIVSVFLKDKTVNTQFIIVSLRNVMNEISDQLLGIYKVDNCTKTLVIKGLGKKKDIGQEKEKAKEVINRDLVHVIGDDATAA